MKILVLGGSGFLGSHLIDRLLDDEHQIFSVDVLKERFRNTSKKATFIEADFGNRRALNQIFIDGIDLVFHLVSTTLPQSSNDDPIFDVQTNLIESLAIFDLCVKYRVKKIIFISSGGTIYGESNERKPLSETAVNFPWCSYGIVKATIEKYLHLYNRLYGLDYTVLRLSNPYGPRQDPTRRHGAAATFMYRMLKNESIDVWGDGSTTRDYIYVSDFSEACVRAANSDFTGVVNIGSGHGISLNELISKIEGTISKPGKVNYLNVREVDVPWVVLSNSLAYEKLAWKPLVPIEYGLYLMSEWMRDCISEKKL
jgi:UDP-glucose 4-epimerase